MLNFPRDPDRIYVDRVFSDGWALGTSVTSGQEGMFPVTVLDRDLGAEHAGSMAAARPWSPQTLPTNEN